MVATETKQKEVSKPSVSWRDFTIEEHVSAYCKAPFGSKTKIYKIGKNTYRVNIFMDSKIVQSAFLTIIQSPEGYIINDFKL